VVIGLFRMNKSVVGLLNLFILGFYSSIGVGDERNGFLKVDLQTVI